MIQQRSLSYYYYYYYYYYYDDDDLPWCYCAWGEGGSQFPWKTALTTAHVTNITMNHHRSDTTH